MPLIDLTQPFTRNMPVFPGDTPAGFQTVAEHEKDGYHGVRIDTGMHIGTHMDAPLHMIPGGKKLNDYPVSWFTGEAHVLDVRGHHVIGPELLDHVDLEHTAILLLHSGWDAHFEAPRYYTEYPEISADFASRLIGTRVRIIGLDWPSPDRAPYKVHHILLGNDILIMENLTKLDSLSPAAAFRVYAFPYTYDMEASPVRVVAEIG